MAMGGIQIMTQAAESGTRSALTDAGEALPRGHPRQNNAPREPQLRPEEDSGVVQASAGRPRAGSGEGAGAMLRTAWAVVERGVCGALPTRFGRESDRARPIARRLGCGPVHVAHSEPPWGAKVPAAV